MGLRQFIDAAVPMGAAILYGPTMKDKVGGSTSLPDLTGNGHTAVLSGAAKLTGADQGLLDGGVAVALDGAAKFVETNLQFISNQRTFVWIGDLETAKSFNGLFGKSSAGRVSLFISATNAATLRLGNGATTTDFAMGTVTTAPSMVALTLDLTAGTAQMTVNGIAFPAVDVSAQEVIETGTTLQIGTTLGAFSNGLALPFAAFLRILSTDEIRQLMISGGFTPPAYIPPPPQLTVLAVGEGGEGQGYDLTDEAEGLQFSNTDPGGDELCTFTLHRSWFAQNPEIAKGDMVYVISGIDVLFRGRVEENDRATGDSETIGVTVYGLGNRLGDFTFREIYADGDMTRWGGIPNERVIALGASWRTDAGQVDTRQAESGLPALAVSLSGTLVNTASAKMIAEAWYDSGGIPIGSVFYEQVNFDSGEGGYGQMKAPWFAQITLLTTESSGSGDVTGTFIPTAGSGTLVATTSDRVYALVSLYYPNAVETNGDWRIEIRKAVVYGLHNLEPKGESPGGFSADQIVGDIISRANGIAARNVSSFAYVIPQFTVTTPTTGRAGIEEVSQYANVDYGVWGPDSPFDRSLDGYFDYTEKDDSTQHWIATRDQFDADLSFHSEISTLYDTVDVSYTDEGGRAVVTRYSQVSPDLQAAGLSPRVYSLDAGETTAAGAQVFAEIFLRIFAGFAPARGSGSLSGTVRHYRRGEIPAYYMRADGSNLRVPDILPAETTFALDSTPDRRTTFPLKRVSVDCSGDYPRTTVEFDQNSDALATLLAQQATQASLVGA